MPKGTNRSVIIRQTVARLFLKQSEWDSKRLRKSCLDALPSADAKERARLGNSIRRILTQLLDGGVLSAGEGDLLLQGPDFHLLESEVSKDAENAPKQEKASEKPEAALAKEAATKKPKEKDMRLFLSELFQSGEMSEEKIVKAAVDRFRVQGERIHGVRGLALQVLKALESEGVISIADGAYSLKNEKAATPAAPVKKSEPKKATAVNVQMQSKKKPRPTLSKVPGGDALDEKRFAALINAQGGAFFNVFVAKLLESYYASVGVSVSGRFVVDGSEDKGIDVVFHTRDELGFSDKVAVQAKTRARSQVTLKELREFYGCVCAEGASRGVFITTATFTTEAVDFLSRSANLAGIDLTKLFELACRFEIGICHRDGKAYAIPELTL